MVNSMALPTPLSLRAAGAFPAAWQSPTSKEIASAQDASQ